MLREMREVLVSQDRRAGHVLLDVSASLHVDGFLEMFMKEFTPEDLAVPRRIVGAVEWPDAYRGSGISACAWHSCGSRSIASDVSRETRRGEARSWIVPAVKGVRGETKTCKRRILRGDVGREMHFRSDMRTDGTVGSPTEVGSLRCVGSAVSVVSRETVQFGRNRLRRS